MNAVSIAGVCRPAVSVGVDVAARVALLGTGTVGSAVLQRLAGWVETPLHGRLSLVYAANSRAAAHDHNGLCPHATRQLSLAPARLDPNPQAGDANSDLGNVGPALGNHTPRILIDATASEAVAERHADWLSQGIHVVTACKLAQGTSLVRWRAVQAGRQHGGSQYGDAATVGAGLPLLRTIRELRAGGDRIHAIAGVLSGSLAWLFNHYDGARRFSDCVREARAGGYTEPDPREDLSGEDVRRKLLILARAAGIELEPADVAVQSLVPPALATCAPAEIDRALDRLDRPLRERFEQARKRGEKLRFIARLQDGRAQVGLESLPVADSLAGGADTDNQLAVWSDRYRHQPLVIQGPGAGAEVTAAALLDDTLRFAAGVPVGQ